MIKRYKDFLFESIILESILVYSDDFKKLIKEIDSPIAKALQEIESKDLTIANNYIDISDDKEQISFTPDRRAQQILSPENREKFVIYQGGVVLKHSEGNDAIFKLLDYEPIGDKMYKPEVGTKGEVLSKAIGPVTGATFLKIKFPDGISAMSQERVRYENVSGLPFIQGRQKVRIGRGITGLLKANDVTFSPSELEKFVNLFKAEYEKMNDIFGKFELVEGEEISKWYNYRTYELGSSKGPLGGSCMSNVPDSYLEIYTSNPDTCQLLILKTDDGEKIKGRALVWKLKSPEGITYMDRIYTHIDSDMELFRQYASKNGWYHKPNNNYISVNDMVAPDGNVVRMGELVVKVGSGGYDEYPYLDTLKYYNYNRGTLSTDEDGDCYTLQETDGSYSGRDECDNCGGEGYVDCGECYGRGDIKCEECNGKSEIQCNDCKGDGEIQCEKCYRTGEIDCRSCGGTGKDGEDECSDCDGTKKSVCPICDGDVKNECNKCEGSGRVDCDECRRGRITCSNCDGAGTVDCDEC
jgi:hypothetical protein